MNAVEADARPALTALVRGERRTMTPADVAAVASWTVKTSLTVQLTSTSSAAALDPVYRDFLRHPEPPANSVVWAAAVNAEDWALRAEAMSVLVAAAGDGLTVDDPPNTLAATFGLGSLLLHSVLTTRPSLSSPPHDEIAPGALVRLWPGPEPTEWPPPRWLTSETAWGVAHSLAFWLSGD